MVADVEPSELMKLRLLNVSRQALAYFSHLMGYRLVHDAVRDRSARRFLLDYMRAEGAPSPPEAAGASVGRAAAIVASWARFAEGVDESGAPIEIVDNRATEVKAAAARQGRDPLAFLRQESFFGARADEPRLTRPHLKALGSPHAVGARATLQALTA